MHSDSPALVTLADIRAAAQRIDDLVLRTPVIEVPHPEDPDRTLLCKAESLQPTGAFKLRGAYNAIVQVIDTARENGIVAQSSGNHARAVAWVARRLGLDAVIVMPEAAPQPKIDAVRALGARVDVVPNSQRDERAAQFVTERGSAHIPPYDDERIIAGQGTIGLELLEQVPDVDVILVPISGGGLISGIATAVKSLRPEVKVIGVEPELAADAQQSLRSGERATWDVLDTYRTIADGLRTPYLGERTWPHVRRYVNDIVTVSEEQILDAVRHLAIAGRLVAEPSGAVTTAAWLTQELPAGKTVAIISGGSTDPALLARILESPRL